jgi:cytochrome c-type biogenesis protein CcmH
MIRVRLTASGLLASTALVIALLLAPAASAAPARASLMDIENDVMCVLCNEPLAVAQSPEAYRERNFIRGLIAKGETKAQIERALVANYGVAVLGKPPAHGFNLTVYLLPPAAVLAGLALLAYTLPRWRRRVRARAALATPAGPSLSAAEQQRLDEELGRFAG